MGEETNLENFMKETGFNQALGGKKKTKKLGKQKSLPGSQAESRPRRMSKLEQNLVLILEHSANKYSVT